MANIVLLLEAVWIRSEAACLETPPTILGLRGIPPQAGLLLRGRFHGMTGTFTPGSYSWGRLRSRKKKHYHETAIRLLTSVSLRWLGAEWKD